MAKKNLKDADYRIKAHLDHFIDQGKWPVRVDKKEAELVKKYLPFLKVIKLTSKNHKDGKYIEFAEENGKIRNYQITAPKKIPNKVLAVYWKFRHDELYERYDELYQEIKKLADIY